MANAKRRASMREGPLADLFRRTEGRPTADEQDAAAASPNAGVPPASPRADAGGGEVADQRASGPDAQASGSERAPTAEMSVRGSAPPRPRSAPHPSLGERDGQIELDEAAERHPLSPKQRLLQAFSADIPADVLDTPSLEAGFRRAREAERAPVESRAAGHPIIRVVGVGGAGTNAVNRMVEAEVAGVEFIAVNTDMQSLQQSTADLTVHIGAQLTRGLGSGSDANVGRQAAMDDYDRMKALLKGSDMIFIAAGAGGGTGTGAAPVVARIAREVGALTVAIVTKPFGFEGSRRADQAARGIDVLAEEVDTLIVVPNNRLLSILDKQTSMVDAFKVADDVLRQGVQGISDLVTLPGLINLDFADVRTIMSEAGNALLGIGMARGENRAIDAALQAVASPLLETSMEGAKSILLSITGGADLSLWEVNEAAKAVSEAAHPDANIIFGALIDEKLDDQVWVTVVATGYSDPGRSRHLREPTGEPVVRRTREQSRSGGRDVRRRGLAVDEYDIPEFLPRR